MMKLQDKKDDDIGVDLTPLIDVVFTLLLFFMVSTTFIHESQIELKLPEASKSATPEDTEKIQIGVDTKGVYYVDGKALINSQTDTLKQAITAAAKQFKQPAIEISADASASHQSVITVMDIVRQLGYVRISLATAIKE